MRNSRGFRAPERRRENRSRGGAARVVTEVRSIVGWLRAGRRRATRGATKFRAVIKRNDSRRGSDRGKRGIRRAVEALWPSRTPVAKPDPEASERDVRGGSRRGSRSEPRGRVPQSSRMWRAAGVRWRGPERAEATVWSRRPDLNRGPAVYETAALPTELRRRDARDINIPFPAVQPRIRSPLEASAAAEFPAPHAPTTRTDAAGPAATTFRVSMTSFA
jgi:hypothetical protein